jgi:hypothetical protein
LVAERINVVDGAFFKGKIEIRKPGQRAEDMNPSSERNEREFPPVSADPPIRRCKQLASSLSLFLPPLIGGKPHYYGIETDKSPSAKTPARALLTLLIGRGKIQRSFQSPEQASTRCVVFDDVDNARLAPQHSQAALLGVVFLAIW